MADLPHDSEQRGKHGHMNENAAASGAAQAKESAYLEDLRAEALSAQKAVRDQLAFAGIDRWTSAAAQVQLPAVDGALSEAMARVDRVNRAASSGALSQVADVVKGATGTTANDWREALLSRRDRDAVDTASSLARSAGDLASRGLAVDVDRLAAAAGGVALPDLVGQVNEGLASAASGLRGALVDLPSSASLYGDVPSLPTMTEVKVQALRSPAHRHTELLSDLVQSQAEMLQTQMVEAQRVMFARQDEELTHHRQQAEESRRRGRGQVQVARANAQDAGRPART